MVLFIWYIYLLKIYISLLTKSTIRDPATATIKEVRLNPVTPTLKNVSPRKPPITAPTIPRTIEPIIPPHGLGAIKLAILPAINPKIIQ